MSALEPYDYMVDEPDDDEPEPYTAEDAAWDRMVEERERAHELGMDLT